MPWPEFAQHGCPCSHLHVIDPVPSLPYPKKASYEELCISLTSQHPKLDLGVPTAFFHGPIQLYQLFQLFSEPARLQLGHGVMGVRPMQAFFTAVTQTTCPQENFWKILPLCGSSGL